MFQEVHFMKTIHVVMSRQAWLVVALSLASPALSMEPMSMPFTDAAPPTFTWPPAGSQDALEGNGGGGPGPCSQSGKEWNWSRSTTGGPDGAGYYEVTWCSGIQLGATGWTESGSGFEGTGFPAEMCAAETVYFVNGLQAGPGGADNHTLKHWLWHSGVLDGDARPILHWSEGGYNPNDAWTVDDKCNGQGTDATHVCYSIERNISSSDSAAYALVPVGQWVYVQWCWKHGNAGTSFVKLWVNNNDYNNPTAQDLSVGDWPQDQQGYRNQWRFASATNTSSILATPLVVRFRDFQMTPAFDPNYYPGSTPPPDGGLGGFDGGPGESDGGSSDSDGGSGDVDAGAGPSGADAGGDGGGQTIDGGGSGSADATPGCGCSFGATPGLLPLWLAAAWLTRRSAPTRRKRGCSR
ncbi:MAG: hypothetical protein ACOZIN_22005 [Myxococcota bacterium]